MKKLFSISLAIAISLMFGAPAYASAALDPVGVATDANGKVVVDFGSGVGAYRSIQAGERLRIQVENLNPTAQEARVALGVPVPAPSGPCYGIASFVSGGLEYVLDKKSLQVEEIGIRYSFELLLAPIPYPIEGEQTSLKIEVDCLKVSTERRINVEAPPEGSPVVEWVGQPRGAVLSVNQKTLATFSGVTTELSAQQRTQIKSVIDANPSAEKFICTGIRYHSQPMEVNIMVRKRAKAACDYAKQLKPSLSTWYQNKPTQARSFAGKVLLTVKFPVQPIEFDTSQKSSKDPVTSPRTPKPLDILDFYVTESSTNIGQVRFTINLASHQHSLNFRNGSAVIGLRFDFNADGVVDGLLSTNNESSGSFGQSFAIYTDFRGGSCKATYEHNPFYPYDFDATPRATFALATSCLNTGNYFGIQAFSTSTIADGDEHPDSTFERFQAPWSFGRVN